MEVPGEAEEAPPRLTRFGTDMGDGLTFVVWWGKNGRQTSWWFGIWLGVCLVRHTTTCVGDGLCFRINE